MNLNEMAALLQNGELNDLLQGLNPVNPASYAGRILALLDLFREHFGEDAELHLFSAPGRVEVGGNHTDHQQGCVLAASVDRDDLAAAACNGTTKIRVWSEGYGGFEMDCRDLAARPEENNSTASLVRGMAAQFAAAGEPVKGFDVCIQSEVPGGSGISSSAAFEVLMGAVLNGLFCEGRYSPVEIAKFGQITEREYFGKPSGLMDQAASAVGGFVAIDFKDNANPRFTAVSVDALRDYCLFVVDSGSAHDDLTQEYAGIPTENHAVAACFGKSVLREVDEADFWQNIAQVRAQCGDRAILRAIHFFEENQRAQDEAAALMAGDTERFLALVRESGRSSFDHLQNVIICGHSDHQEVAYALAVCEHALQGRGAVRVHGGGFAGTVLAFVPKDSAEAFAAEVNGCLKAGACRQLTVRSVGCVQIL